MQGHSRTALQSRHRPTYYGTGGTRAAACRWFEALETRDTYAATQSDHYTHCWDIPPQYGTCWPAPGSEGYAKAINGIDGESWCLPLAPIDSESFEARSNVKEGGLVRRSRACCPLSCLWWMPWLVRLHIELFTRVPGEP
jgi:hypothetical protein